jgi:hypothetical protein
VTIENATPARDVVLLRVLRELHDEALAARPYVEHSQPGRYVGGLVVELRVEGVAIVTVRGELLAQERALAADALLERLDAALVEAGELLAEASA